jgi:hypothetical protein
LASKPIDGFLQVSNGIHLAQLCLGHTISFILAQVFGSLYLLERRGRLGVIRGFTGLEFLGLLLEGVDKFALPG